MIASVCVLILWYVLCLFRLRPLAVSGCIFITFLCLTVSFGIIGRILLLAVNPEKILMFLPTCLGLLLSVPIFRLDRSLTVQAIGLTSPRTASLPLSACLPSPMQVVMSRKLVLRMVFRPLLRSPFFPSVVIV